MEYYIARFELKRDCMHALLNGLWKIFDHYVVPWRWKSDFDSKTTKVDKMTVWVQLPSLPMEYFRDDVIKMILEHAGTHLKLDRKTAGVEREKFARAAIEIDLLKPLVSMVCIQRKVKRNRV